MKRRTLLLGAAAGALAGCASVPTSGPVTQVSADPGRINPGVEIAPAPPGRDATPSEVVEGFLHAMASWQPGYRLARAYLTPAADAEWNPDAGVRIYAEGNPVVATDDSAVLSAPVVGTLDHLGSYRQSSGEIDHDFGLVTDADGQWRIDHPPEGLIVSEYLFTSAFTRVVVYFFAPGQQWLVPDPRYFPRGSYALEGAVRSVVSTPTAWLAPGLDPASPVVGLDSVRVDTDGVAQVVLRRTGPDLSDAERRALAVRLVWTLRPFENVAAVEVGWAGQSPWQVEGQGRLVAVDAFADADPQDRQTSRQLFAVVAGRVVRLVEVPDGLEAIETAPGLDAVAYAAVRPDALAAAGVNADRSQLLVAPMTQPGAEPVASAIGLRRPHYARQGELWFVDDRGAVGAVLPDGRTVAVMVTGSAEGRVGALRVAPDGVRIAFVMDGPGGGTVALGVIVRAEDEVRVEGVRALSVTESELTQRTVRDVGWRSADTLCVLVADGRTTTVMSVAQDGSVLAPIGPTGEDGLVELAVAPGVPALARSTEGELLRYNADFRWSAQQSSASSVFYPG